MGNFYRRFIFIVAVGVFSSIGFAANASENLLTKPKPNPAVESVTKLYAEREIISSKIFLWEIQSTLSTEFAELMVENPTTLEGEERIAYYNNLLDKINYNFFEIDKALSNESGSDSLGKLSSSLTLFSAMTKALLSGARIAEVEDILKDSKALNPRFSSLVELLKNQSTNLTKLLESYEDRSSLNRPQFYRAVQYQSEHNKYAEAVFLETKFIDFAKDQILLNNKLLRIMLSDLYLIEPGSEEEFFFQDILSRKAKLQNNFYFSHYPDFKAKLEIFKLDLLLIRFLNDPEQKMLSEESSLNNPFKKMMESKANAINHIEVYTNLDAKFESEHYRLLKLTSIPPKLKKLEESD